MCRTVVLSVHQSLYRFGSVTAPTVWFLQDTSFYLLVNSAWNLAWQTHPFTNKMAHKINHSCIVAVYSSKPRPSFMRISKSKTVLFHFIYIYLQLGIFLEHWNKKTTFRGHCNSILETLTNQRFGHGGQIQSPWKFSHLYWAIYLSGTDTLYQ